MVPMIPAQLDRIQSMAIQKRVGASTQPWRTPQVISNGSDSWPPTLTRDVVPVCRFSISWIRNAGAPDDLSTFHSQCSPIHGVDHCLNVDISDVNGV